MTAEPLRLGIVGCGRLAEAGYVPALARCRGFDLVAVADRDPERRQRVATLAAGADRPVTCHADAADLLQHSRVDAVIIATPAAAHCADAALAAGAGVAALVEKPPAPDAAGAGVLARLDPAPWIGFNRRFDTGVRGVLDRIPSTGDVDLRLELTYRRRSWAAHTVRDDALLDLGPHLVDWTRWLTASEIVEVVGVELSTERVEVQLCLTRGRAMIRAATNRIHRERVDAYDASGSLLARHRVGGAAAAVRGRLRRGPTPTPLVTSLAAQLDAFGTAVRGERQSTLATAVDGYAAMVVIDAARAARVTGPRSVSALPT